MWLEPIRHAELSEESHVIPDLRPFTSFGVTPKDRFSAIAKMSQFYSQNGLGRPQLLAIEAKKTDTR